MQIDYMGNRSLLVPPYRGHFLPSHRSGGVSSDCYHGVACSLPSLKPSDAAKESAAAATEQHSWTVTELRICKVPSTGVCKADNATEDRPLTERTSIRWSWPCGCQAMPMLLLQATYNPLPAELAQCGKSKPAFSSRISALL